MVSAGMDGDVLWHIWLALAVAKFTYASCFSVHAACMHCVPGLAAAEHPPQAPSLHAARGPVEVAHGTACCLALLHGCLGCQGPPNNSMKRRYAPGCHASSSPSRIMRFSWCWWRPFGAAVAPDVGAGCQFSSSCCISVSLQDAMP